MKRVSSLLAAAALLALAAPCSARATDLFSVSSFHPTSPVHNDDTIIVRLPNQAVMTLYVKNKAQLRQLQNYKLDSLMTVLNGYISQAEAAGKNSQSGEVTTEFYPAKDHPGAGVPEQIRITVRNEDGQGKPQKPTAERVDVTLGRAGSVVVVESKDGQGNGHVSIHIDDKKDVNRDSLRLARRQRDANRSSKNAFGMDLGLNALVNKSAPISGQPIDLRPFGSRYVSLYWRYAQRLGGKGSPMYLLLGPEFSFNNFMLDNDTRFVSNTSLINGQPNYTTVERVGYNLGKSKLAMSSVNLPVMLQANLRDKEYRKTFRLAAGGFVGYRLGAHTKLKYDQDGDTKKDKDRRSYNLEDFQYGLQGSIGFRKVDLFAKYHLNELFKDNRGPQAQSLSFGITLFGLD